MKENAEVELLHLCRYRVSSQSDWFRTWLFSHHSSYLAGPPGGSWSADAAALGARQQGLAVVLAGPAVTGMLLGHVLLCGSFQVELLQTSTLHLLHQLMQRTQL